MVLPDLRWFGLAYSSDLLPSHVNHHRHRLPAAPGDIKLIPLYRSLPFALAWSSLSLDSADLFPHLALSQILYLITLFCFLHNSYYHLQAKFINLFTCLVSVFIEACSPLKTLGLK